MRIMGAMSRKVPSPSSNPLMRRRSTYLLAVRRQEELGGARGNLQDGQHVAEGHREADEHHHHGHRLHRAVDEMGQIAPAVVAVDEDGDEEGVHAGDGRRLGGGEDTAEDSPQDDDHGDQPPHGVEGDPEGLPEGDGLRLGEPPPVGGDENEADQAEAEEQAGENASQEQVSDGDGAPGGQRVDDRVVRGRDEHGLDRAADGDVGGEHARIARPAPSGGS